MTCLRSSFSRSLAAMVSMLVVAVVVMAVPPSGHPFVRGQRQGVDELVGDGDLHEQRPRFVVRAWLPTELGDLLVRHALHQVAGDSAAGVREGDIVVQPLPYLRTGDLGRGGILHQ